MSRRYICQCNLLTLIQIKDRGKQMHEEYNVPIDIIMRGDSIDWLLLPDANNRKKS